MPLVLMCGFPCSGKSLRTQQLRDYFQVKESVQVVTSDEERSLRNSVFADSRRETQLRGELKSEVIRLLSKEQLVILDSANYIKGFRYELYCLSKSVKTTHCVIHTDTAVDTCWQWNSQRPQEEQYSKEIFDGLVQRFEAPDSRNRWDSPLFTVHRDEELPLEAVQEALRGRKAPPPNLATQCQPLASPNFLYDLDRVTSETIKAILKEQYTCAEGDELAVPGCSEKVVLHHKFGAGELTRLRRQFLVYTKSHPVDDVAKIPNLFVHYLNTTAS